MACFRCLQAISDDNFHVGFNRIYDKNLARSLRNIFKKHVHLFKGLEDRYDLDLAARCTSIRDFDDAITRRTFGECVARSIPHCNACLLGNSPGHVKQTAWHAPTVTSATVCTNIVVPCTQSCMQPIGVVVQWCSGVEVARQHGLCPSWCVKHLQAHVGFVSLNMANDCCCVQIGQVWMLTTMAPAAHTPSQMSRSPYCAFRYYTVSKAFQACNGSCT